MSYADVLCATADTKRLTPILHRLQIAAQTPIMDAEDAVEKLAKKFQLTQSEREQIINQYISGNDPTVFGLINATTEAAKEAETIQRRVELQTIGGKLLPMAA